MAIRPDGKRALISFLHTGNFAVLDLEAQQHFPGGDPAADHFRGPVAVTPPLRLDNALWPKKKDCYDVADDACTLPDSALWPKNPDDERLLFPWDIKYAQNGRFAAVTHAGSPTRGGAVSIIFDKAITEDFAQHLNETVPVTVNGTSVQTPFYLNIPICKPTVSSNGSRISKCATHLADYRTAAGEKSFKSLRGVAIQPFVAFVAPVHGDHVGLSTGTISTGVIHGSRASRLWCLTRIILIPPPANPRKWGASVSL